MCDLTMSVSLLPPTEKPFQGYGFSFNLGYGIRRFMGCRQAQSSWVMTSRAEVNYSPNDKMGEQEIRAFSYITYVLGLFVMIRKKAA